ncbi:hypothetical protein FN846DRAFT_603683 [Sphaerosporella brunnea]|uniref:Rhodopsin domain-containing protein n=1 Tax=Sphaerosporella brunnea TaxID=1250544 RepID=A0A5J5F1G7_9PEZI|nr:hypothetical protein FN846DRAFT_603683 [Sphaerosporella brunnea]
MLKYENRIAFDLALFLPGFFFISLRLWIRNRNRLPNPHLTWILSDVFVALSLIIAASVISLDLWYMQRRIRLRDYPKEEDPAGYFVETITISIEFLKVSLFNQYGYICALWSVKASFLCSYYSMSRHLSVKLRQVMKLTWVALLLTLLGLVFGFTFWCRPIERNWSIDQDYFCSPQAKPAQAVLVYALHIGTDIPIMAIPFFIIHTLKLGRSEKYAISFMFLLGFMTVATSTFSFILHMQFIKLEQYGIYGPSGDALGEKLEGIYLSAVAEVFGAVFIVCLPSTRIAVRTCLSRIRRTPEESQSQVGDSDNGLIELSPKVLVNGSV